jgi:hypothetical protein
MMTRSTNKSLTDLEVLLSDFRGYLNDTSASASFAAMGLQHLANYFGSIPSSPTNPDPTVHIGVGDPNLPNAVAYAVLRRSQVLDKIAPGGLVEVRLGQQWIVNVLTAWEHEYRPRLAAVHGCATGELKYPLLGDLRLLRNDVVHHHGIATDENSGRCKILRGWIRVNEPIVVGGQQFAHFTQVFPWADMAKGPSTSI